MSFNIITFGKRRENLVLAIEHKTIGSFQSTFQNYLKQGSIVFLHCEGKIWATGKVVSDYFFATNVVWEDKVYPHRFGISEIKVLSEPIALVNGDYNVELRKRYGTGWAYTFLFSPKPLPIDIAERLLKEVQTKYSTTSVPVVTDVVTTSRQRQNSKPGLISPDFV